MEPSGRAAPDLPEFLWARDDPVETVPRRPTRENAGHIPGEGGLWIFILGDMTLFAAILLVFLLHRRADPAAFGESARHLVQPIGAANTIVLLASSYLVVRAVFAHRGGRLRLARACVTAAICCAATFAGLKAIEYSGEVSAGHTPTSSTFFTFYFVLTGLHLLHVIAGTALLLGWRLMLVRRRAWPSVSRVVEGIASYWHMVDLLWVAIFTLVYLVSAE